MANGTYGTRKPAQITSGDIDIFYSYKPDYSTDDPQYSNFKQLSSGLLVAAKGEYSSGGNAIDLPGMYNLRLPLDVFSKKGIYTVYIKPKEIFTAIVDADARLAAYPNIRGIVLNAGQLQGLEKNGSLIGYRVEYFSEENPDVRTGEYRIITSNNKCESSTTQVLNNASQKSTSYIFNDASNLVYCTVTPSSSLSFKSDSVINIGKTGQRIALVNTKFNPVALEIEMTEHDLESISTMLEGDQLRNLDAGIITTFNKDGGVYHQALYGNITNPSTGINHDFKIAKKANIIFNEEERLKEINENI